MSGLTITIGSLEEMCDLMCDNRIPESATVKPCPFCGNDDERRFTFRFSTDRKKVNGIHYSLCTMRCDCCGANIRQAGPNDERAEENVRRMWNRRA